MQNPFTMPLSYGPNTGYDLPSGDIDEYPSASTLDLTGLGGGPAAYMGPQSAHDGLDELSYLANPGVTSQPVGLNPAAGSSDLIAPRDAYGVPGTDRILKSPGPNTMRDTGYTGLQGELNTPNPAYAGPVTGGPDYAAAVSANYFASQAQALSDQATASALLAAI